MNWLPKRGKKNNYLKNLKAEKHLLNSKPQAAILLVCLATVGVFLSGDSQLKTKTFALISPRAHDANADIERIATDISVKVLGSDFLGSGFIIQRERYSYTVITNQHVLRAGEAPYKIQTADGTIYPVEVITDLISKEYDLALLKFKATNGIYPTASIGSSLYLKVGDPIFAAGFPYTKQENIDSVGEQILGRLSGFTLKEGRIAIVLNKALEEGYQIGYTNDVKKGMSGGPLLNSRGEVVGVNGKHAYPLWEAPDFYQDGSQPCPPLQELITRSSLAIPIEKGLGLTTKLKSLQPLADAEATGNSNLAADSKTSGNSSKLVAKMQAEAEASANCQNSP